MATSDHHELEKDSPLITDDIIAAASGLRNVEPLCRMVNKAYRVSVGVSVLLRMIQSNEELEARGLPESERLGKFTIGALTWLAQEAVDGLAGEAEDVTKWLEDHGVPEPEKTAKKKKKR